jgi:hypothetical protein
MRPGRLRRTIFLNQKSCGMKRVAREHDDVAAQPVGAEGAVLEDEALELAARVPGHEELGGVGEADQHARSSMMIFDIVLHVVDR